MQESPATRLIHFTRDHSSLACGRLPGEEAGSSSSWSTVTCPDCLTARRQRRRNVILAGVGSGIVGIAAAVIIGLALSIDGSERTLLR